MLANDEVTTVQNIAEDVEQNNFEKSVNLTIIFTLSKFWSSVEIKLCTFKK